jgi:hypothetical protein
MNRNRNLTVVLALAAGLLGGFLSRYITVPSVHAQAQPNDAVEIRSQRFTFVDPKGRVIATFTRAIPTQGGYGKTAPRIAITLVDPDGHELWSAGGYGFKPLADTSK